MSFLETCNKIRLQDKLAKQEIEILCLKLLIHVLNNDNLNTDFKEFEKEELVLFESFNAIHSEILRNFENFPCKLSQALKPEFLSIEIIKPEDFVSLVDLNLFISETLIKLRKIQNFLSEHINEFQKDFKSYFMICAQINLMNEKLNQLVQKLQFYLLCLKQNNNI